MKIIYIIHATYNSAGMERVLSLKANFLADKIGYEIIIITTDQKNRASYYTLSEKINCYDLGINFEDYYNYSFFKRINSFRKKQKKFKKILTRVLLEEKADIVVSLMSRTLSFLTSIPDGSKKVYEQHFNRYYRKYLVQNNHFSFIWSLVYQWRAFWEKIYLRKVDAFVVLTQEDARLWGNPSNIEVIPNMYSFFPKEIAKLENRIIITVGRLEYQKGYDQLINIWKLVHEKYPDWNLEIIGKGEYESLIMNQLKEYNFLDVIKISSPTLDIESKLLNASIYLMTSRFEGFPMVLVEAMACGLPIVSFQCPCGPADIIKNDNDGYLIPSGNFSLMAEKIIHLIEDKEKRINMGRNARNNVKRFSQEIIMFKWIELFNKLIDKYE